MSVERLYRHTMYLKVTIVNNNGKNFPRIFRSDMISYNNDVHYKINVKNVHVLLMSNIDMSDSDKKTISPVVRVLVERLFEYLPYGKIYDPPLSFLHPSNLDDGTPIIIKLKHYFTCSKKDTFLV